MLEFMLLSVVTDYLKALDALDLALYDPEAIQVVGDAEARLRAAVALCEGVRMDPVVVH